MKELLIIGGVAAGATAAARARRLNNDISITLLEAGADVSFANCGLPYYIGGDIEYRSSLILSSPETFNDQYRVDVHTNTEAIRIDRAAKRVVARNTQTGKKRTFTYDALILAQGGKPLIPPVLGADKAHVFQLWTLDDMDRIDAFLKEREPRTAVVVGGGFIGLEMVEALRKRGLDVHLVEMAKQVMPNLEGEFAGFLQKELLDYGVKLHLGTSLTAIGDADVTLSDGTSLPADFVLLSVGVRPTLALAKEAGLEIGAAGGLAVSAALCTSDPAIYAAGDMVEIDHSVMGRKVRIPLAGPANRQGRIAAENALGGSREYKGAMGTSVVKLFGAVAGSVGMSLRAACDLGLDADAVVVHKTSHTAYYPGAEKVSLMLIFDRQSGRVLGAQAAGRVGVDKRIDVAATAIAGELTLSDLEELDLAYAPPFNSPNGPVNMAAFTAENHRSGFSPSVLAQEFEGWVTEHEPIVLDLRDPITFGKGHLAGSTNLSHNLLRENIDRVPKEEPIALISDDGQKGHVALRMLAGAGYRKVVNVSGGYISLERHARAIGFEHLKVGLLPVESKRVEDLEGGAPDGEGAGTAGGTAGAAAEATAAAAKATDAPLIVDVRTPTEFATGAYPGAINVGLDELGVRAGEFGRPDREIIVYCASGARSSYAQRVLEQHGYKNVRNGGGLHDMMASV
ncbi:MAG: CoA-disulfide reductase [Spirochaetaceae bacterium]|nr:MAG: CoA-disulfide reductase [Spirochaetaceae bacterium]